MRVYDKILDTIKKSKQSLYKFTEKELTRVEIEFLEKEIQGLNSQNSDLVTYTTLLQDNDLLKNLFLSRIATKMTYFTDIYKIYDFVYPKASRISLERYFLEKKQLPKWWRINAL